MLFCWKLFIFRKSEFSIDLYSLITLKHTLFRYFQTFYVFSFKNTPPLTTKKSIIFYIHPHSLSKRHFSHISLNCTVPHCKYFSFFRCCCPQASFLTFLLFFFYPVSFVLDQFSSHGLMIIVLSYPPFNALCVLWAMGWFSHIQYTSTLSLCMARGEKSARYNNPDLCIWLMNYSGYAHSFFLFIFSFSLLFGYIYIYIRNRFVFREARTQC